MVDCRHCGATYEECERLLQAKPPFLGACCDDCHHDNSCDLCGEEFLPEGDPMAYQGMDERAEFVVDKPGLVYGRAVPDPTGGHEWREIPVGEHVYAHASCGLERGLTLA